MYKLLLCLTAIYLVEGCLITNCPKGGKRSPNVINDRVREPPKEKEVTCRRCGPNQEGRCLGPSICCGPMIGCLVGTPGILSQCSQQPLQLPRQAKPCSIGVCVSDGVCCATGGCRIDLNCEMEYMTDICNLAEQTAD